MFKTLFNKIHFLWLFVLNFFHRTKDEPWNSEVTLKGHIHAVVKHADGSESVYDFPNLVMTNGKALTAARLCSNAQAALGWMAIGSDSTPASAGQTALIAELGRVADDSATPAGAVATFVATFPAGTGTGTIQEAGMFNANTAGTMFSRSTFTAIPKGASDSLQLTWAVTVS